MFIKNEDVEELKLYCDSIKHSKGLSREEEYDLGIRIQQGDKEALNRLVEANLKYVVRIAKRFAWSQIPIYDLISEGNLALIKAATKFNPEMKIKFITYADRWIRQSLSEFVKKSNINKEFSGVDSFVINDESSETVNLEYNTDNYNTDNSAILAQHQSDAINQLTSCLTDREYKILESYFGLNDTKPMTLDEIGKVMDLTQERVRQLKDSGIMKMQFKAMSDNNYREFKEIY